MWFCVAAGFGVLLRYLADFYLPGLGILLVNIVGSFFAGAALGLFQIIDDVAPAVSHLVLGGFAGSLTTYATVAMVTAQQRIQRTGHPARSAGRMSHMYGRGGGLFGDGDKWSSAA